MLGADDVGSRFEGTLTYHPTCHSLRHLRVGDAPLRLLRAVPGLELVELPEAEECCGFGGTFAVKNADVSAAMLEEKLGNVLATGADVVCACDASCLMHMGGGLASPGSGDAPLAPGGDPRLVSASARDARVESFPHAAPAALANAQQRRNVRAATTSIRARRAGVAAELPDWEELRDAGAAIKDAALRRLDEALVELEQAVVAAGGVVHWARDAAEANAVVASLVLAEGADEVVKVKSLATDEIRLNEALERTGVTPIETDLAELIVQLAGERPSHLLVPALHKNRTEIRDLFRDQLGLPGLTDDPAELAEAARLHLRAAFLRARVAISGANFAVAETGTVCVVESEGNGRMCTTLPRSADHGDGDREGDPRVARSRRCCCSSCRARRPASG